MLQDWLLFRLTYYRVIQILKDKKLKYRVVDYFRGARGSAVVDALRYKVAGSISDGVIGIFH
jgi:hypothetical protein